jgi:hypothetical protein
MGLSCHHAAVEPEAAELLMLISEKIASICVVLECRPAAGEISIEYRGREHVLQFDEKVLLHVLEDDEQLGIDLWCEGLPRGEAVARLASVHLEESLETRDPGPRRRWRYDGSFFHPR